MAFDYKKEYKEFYMPKKKPSIVEIPKMSYIAVRGKGNPNEENSEYKNSIGLLYAIAFTIKMSYKGTHKIDGYFEYVVPQKCPYCHAELQDEASFCLYCMRNLNEKVTIETPKKRISKKVKIIICVVLAIAVAASAVSYAAIKNSKICTFSTFYECFQAANEKLGYEELWSISELKDYYVDKDWTTYSLPLKNDDIEIGIYFYKGGKEILAVIGRCML